MRKFELVIAGGGLAAARAIKSYREAGGGGRVALRSEEAVLPYHRPALSKRYLRGETDAPFAEDEAFYRDHDVEVLLETAITAVDVAARRVSTDDGTLGYDKLLIATGATPRRLKVPGTDLEGVYALRTLEDSDQIREAAGTAERAVVVGGGFIGMEVAASLRQLGLEVTLIHHGSDLFDKLGSSQLSEDLASLYREHGVDVLLGEEVARFGGDDRLTIVETKDGRSVEADIAVIGVGVVPNVDFLTGSGLALDNGVVVNERFEASAPGVYAAGDVANFFDPLYERRRRIEHWSNANYQGTEVGKILAGADGGYDTVSSFFSEVFGVGLKVFGDVSGFDELTTEGSLSSGALLAGYGDGGRLVGALAVGQSEETEARVRGLIQDRAPIRSLRNELAGSGELTVTSHLHRLSALGQSVWIDYLSRDLLDSGELARLMVEDAVVGVTSNPTIFQKAISAGSAYDTQLREMREQEIDPKESFYELAARDIAAACDLLRPSWEATSGLDGYVSWEIDPNLAGDRKASTEEAHRLHAWIDRPNLYVKIPATAAGVGAIEDMVAAAKNINVTLIFSLRRYNEVVEAYIRGLERLVADGGDPAAVHSVASFFVSRVDTEVDRRLEAIGGHDGLRGKLGIANAKLAYQSYLEAFSGPRWERLASKGATPQRCLWASTSTKDPAYPDVMYVEGLIGPETVDTMPEETIRAFQDHGRAAETLTQGAEEAQRLMEELERVGVDYHDVVSTLEQEGVEKFLDSFVELLACVREKQAALVAAGG